MKFEHFALNVPDARAAVAWYVDHLGLRILRQRAEAPYTTFLADDTGRVLMELYTNDAAMIPNHAAAHPLSYHAAFVAPDARAERARLGARRRHPVQGGDPAGRHGAHHDARPLGRRLAVLPAGQALLRAGRRRPRSGKIWLFNPEGRRMVDPLYAENPDYL